MGAAASSALETPISKSAPWENEAPVSGADLEQLARADAPREVRVQIGAR